MIVGWSIFSRAALSDSFQKVVALLGESCSLVVDLLFYTTKLHSLITLLRRFAHWWWPVWSKVLWASHDLQTGAVRSKLWGTGLLPPNTEVFCFGLDFLQISWGKVSVHCQNFTEINIHATVKTSLLRQYGFYRLLFWGLKAADFAQLC